MAGSDKVKEATDMIMQAITANPMIARQVQNARLQRLLSAPSAPSNGDGSALGNEIEGNVVGGVPSNGLSGALPDPYTDQFNSPKDKRWADRYGGTVPYYPSQKYLNKNWAPQQGVSKQWLEALADANQTARKNGLMSPGLADKMLPVALVEGSQSFLRDWGYPPSKTDQEIWRKAGLSGTYDQSFGGNTDYERALNYAKAAHAMMAKKAQLYGDDLAVERWNGKGKAGANGTLADATQHARKVEEMSRLLGNPANAGMKQMWDTFSQKYKKASGALPDPGQE